MIAEKGARANGRVVDLLEAGRVKGLAHLSLELTSFLSSDGQKVELRTARFEKEGPASKVEDGQKVGIGAAIGAAIGAIAGGGKGAAIGAAGGGAAGGGVVAATRGKPAVLPAETKISFRVEQPVTITPSAGEDCYSVSLGGAGGSSGSTSKLSGVNTTTRTWPLLPIGPMGLPFKQNIDPAGVADRHPGGVEAGERLGLAGLQEPGEKPLAFAGDREPGFFGGRKIQDDVIDSVHD